MFLSKVMTNAYGMADMGWLMFVQGKTRVSARVSAGLCCLGGMLDRLCGYLSPVGEL